MTLARDNRHFECCGLVCARCAACHTESGRDLQCECEESICPRIVVSAREGSSMDEPAPELWARCCICDKVITEADYDAQRVIATFRPGVGHVDVAACTDHFFRDGKSTPDYEENIRKLALENVKALGLPIRKDAR